MLLSGIISVNKPKNYSSFQIVALVKKKLKLQKAGHDGTLDPFASGVLSIYVNKATKLITYINTIRKVYVATLRLGIKTDTGDLTGKILLEKDFSGLSEKSLKNAVGTFLGTTIQKPSIFSAIKFQGKPLYAYARSGEPINAKERKIEVHSVEILKFEPPEVLLKITCNKGTYIRTLCEDITEQLDCVCHLTDLQRTENGIFFLKDCRSFEEIVSDLDFKEKRGWVTELDKVFALFPSVEVDQSVKRALQTGNKNLVSEFLKKKFRTVENISLQNFTFREQTGKLFGIFFLNPDFTFNYKLFE